MGIALRMIRRRDAWDDPDVSLDEILALEFVRDATVDLTPSVYEVEESEVVRVACEHAGATFRSPDKIAAIDLSGGGKLRKVPGTTGFTFADARHRDLVFSDRAALRAHVGVARNELQSRRRDVPRAVIKDYVRSVVEHSEWVAIFDNPERKRWARFRT